MFVETKPGRTDIGDGLVVRSVETMADVERLAVFNAKVHGPEESGASRRLILEHPSTRPEHWLIVEESRANRIVSTLCLIPWRFRLGSVDLRSGEMGFVGTDPEYRERGLIRRLVQRYEELLKEGGCDLTHIQGIAGFYGQFGYSHAVPLIPDLRVSPAIAGAAAKDAEPLVFRPAKVDDANVLTELYRYTVASAALSSCRSQAEWHYLIEGPSIGEGETWLFCREEGDPPVGYFRIHKLGFGDGLIVSEVALPGAWAAGALLGRLAEIAADWKRPYIKLQMDPACDLAILARDLGGQYLSNYAWQIRLVDPPAFLMRIGPILEERIAASMYAGLTDHVVITTYPDSMRLVFQDGKLAAVDKPDSGEKPAARMPPAALVPLVLGYRSLDELAATNHDIGSPGSSRTLLRTLFPKIRAYFHTIY